MPDMNGVLSSVFDASKSALRVTGAAARVAGTETNLTVVNTVTETTLASLAIPAGSSAVGDLYYFHAAGTLLNNSGATVNYTWRFKLNGTNILVSAVVGATTSTSRRRWIYDGNIVVANTANSQKVDGTLAVSGSSTDTTLAVSASSQFGSNPTAAVDLGNETTVAFSIEMGTANALADCILTCAELIRLR